MGHRDTEVAGNGLDSGSEVSEWSQELRHGAMITDAFVEIFEINESDL